MFYVYDLIDPRDGATFYVGKGSGRRFKRHAQEAKQGLPGPKCDRIREILAAGLQVRIKIIREFTDELRAYAFEKRRIAKLGPDNLTNIAAGGGGVRKEVVERRAVSKLDVFAVLVRGIASRRPLPGEWAGAIRRAAERKLPEILADLRREMGDAQLMESLRAQNIVLEIS